MIFFYFVIEYVLYFYKYYPYLIEEVHFSFIARIDVYEIGHEVK